MSRILVAAALSLAATSLAVGQTSGNQTNQGSSQQVPAQGMQSLQGVWRIVEVTFADPNEPTLRNPQPSQVIYTKNHYSYIAINGGEHRPKVEKPQTTGKFTDAEKIARYEHWARLTAHSGTYEVRGGILTTQAVVAKNEAVMRGVEKFEVKVENQMLWLVSRENGYTLKLVRVE